MTNPGPLATYEVEMNGYRTKVQLTEREARRRKLLDPDHGDQEVQGSAEPAHNKARAPHTKRGGN
ncbi:hypothetical protein HNR23_002240 [Nocardiopsis mwathae]|uniref:Uncharacterized protein n=1 Tax=Nocardiopsis mwathae TaxID=1472723 RepID=A0A7W9YHC8_9ACTN|nr:hypothetical protein [Nocardiopsis mwathae]MBB6172180.1 hypothetical protein [Nocardiopsis mwathae]